MANDAQLRFSAPQLESFAMASGDRNPLHLDREFAAATPFGAPIVHGALIAIAMISSLPPRAQSALRTVRASFSGALALETTATLSALASPSEADSWELRLSAHGRPVARVLARGAVEPLSRDAPALPGPGDSLTAMRDTPGTPDISALAAGWTWTSAYSSAPELAALAAALGADGLDSRLLEGLGWASYVVGMELPGLHSLLAGVTLSVDKGRALGGLGSEQQALRLAHHDERSGQLTIDGALGARSGELRAHARIQCFALAQALAPDPVRLRVGATAAPDRGAVVIAGGSRGFGASLALALLGMGYEVHLGYRTSAARASQLLELAGEQARRLRLVQVDLGDPQSVRSLLDSVGQSSSPLAGLVLNAAPPPLSLGLTAGEPGVELAAYVADSLRLVAVPLGSLLEQLDRDQGWVLFCSSSALASPPRDWPHYVSAKAAVEGLAGWVAANHPKLRSVIVRPPKMLTAMTGTPSGRVGAASADDVAVWTLERLCDPRLERGLTILEPPSVLPLAGEVASA
jgi:NAD(P)-dependent dehydrogenase (short-subunit alcohol dehydrogenase family)